jgi:hypothetical protein
MGWFVAACRLAMHDADAAVFGVAFLGRDGGEVQGRLADCWNVPFEDVRPVRAFLSYQGQRSFSGYWWSATTLGHVGFESRLERDQAMMLDFDPSVKAFSSQPFWLPWADSERMRRHAPDFFARQGDGTGLVIDVRSDDRIPDNDAEAFGAAAGDAPGWLGPLGPGERLDGRGGLACVLAVLMQFSCTSIALSPSAISPDAPRAL